MAGIIRDHETPRKAQAFQASRESFTANRGMPNPGDKQGIFYLFYFETDQKTVVVADL
ncbi:hypothetical protein [Rhizobium tropici]|uniref:hypothetical protein n=1 Tax=Rhizobium tropici TaxID=398 RepID=UPI001AECA30A|nr:hypothetical protein [Rhizobium tropici]